MVDFFWQKLFWDHFFLVYLGTLGGLFKQIVQPTQLLAGLGCGNFRKLNFVFDQGDLCTIFEMGWISGNDTAVFENGTFMDDINTLPSEVVAVLTGVEFGMCVDKIVDTTMKYVDILDK